MNLRANEPINYQTNNHQPFLKAINLAWMEAHIHSVYESEFYRVLTLDAAARSVAHQSQSTVKPLPSVLLGRATFSLMFSDSYIGCILVTQPCYENGHSYAFHSG